MFKRVMCGGAAVLALVLAGLLASCDYPEQGYYELVGLDASLTVVQRVPLQVEELVDDTEMTYGFNILLAGEGELIEVPMVNGADKSRRYWSVAVGQGDTGLGDLVFELEHRAERLSLKGGYRSVEGEPAYAFAAFAAPEEVTGRTRLVPNGTWPPLAAALKDNGVMYFELRTITRQEFITECGGIAPEDLPRRDAAAVDLGDVLPQPEQAAQAAATQAGADDAAGASTVPVEERRKAPPTLGGRRGNSRK
jgi:hypothetical protein